MQNRIKPWMLFTAVVIFYTWYLAAGFIVNATRLPYTLQGTAGAVLDFCTRFNMEMEAFVQIHAAILPFVFVLYTVFLLLAYKMFTKPQKIVFGLLPCAAIFGNLIAMQVGAWLYG